MEEEEEVRIKVMRTRVYLKAAAEDKKVRNNTDIRIVGLKSCSWELTRVGD